MSSKHFCQVKFLALFIFLDMSRIFKSKLQDTNINSITIGENIRNIRKRMALTQKEVAEKIGITRVLFSDYERGRVHVYGDMIARIAIALNVSADEILGLTIDKKTQDSSSLRYMKRIKQIEKLPEHKKKEILRTIDILIRAANMKK